MQCRRRYPRTSDTYDLSASLLSGDGRRLSPRRVVDLSLGGMRVSGEELEMGDVTTFQLTGPQLRSDGRAVVVHRSGGQTGLRFLEVKTSPGQSHVDRPAPETFLG